MLRSIDRGLAALSLLLAMLLVVLLFTGPGWIGLGGSGGYGGGGSPGGTRSGAALFQSAGCLSCHTLAAAGAHGSTGPDLDRARPSAADVRQALRSGPGAMPSYANRLTRAQIAALARYVSHVAGH